MKRLINDIHGKFKLDVQKDVKSLSNLILMAVAVFAFTVFLI